MLCIFVAHDISDVLPIQNILSTLTIHELPQAQNLQLKELLKYPKICQTSEICSYVMYTNFSQFSPSKQLHQAWKFIVYDRLSYIFSEGQQYVVCWFAMCSVVTNLEHTYIQINTNIQNFISYRTIFLNSGKWFFVHFFLANPVWGGQLLCHSFPPHCIDKIRQNKTK